MNKDQILGVVRALLAAGAGYLAASGLIPAETVNELVSAALVIATAVWSVASNKAPKA